MVDSVLWKRWQRRRDSEALAELMARHASLVFGTCRRILGNATDAEDVTQECFVELLRGGARGVRVDGSFAPFLHTLAVRRASDWLRRDRRRRARETQACEERRSTPLRAEADEVDEIVALVDEAITALPESLRRPLVARYLEGATNTAIAARLGIAESTVRHRVGRGVERVRRLLAARGLTVPLALLGGSFARLHLDAAPPSTLARLGKLSLGASAVSTSAVSSVFTGALVMKKLSIALGIAAAVAALCIWFLAPGRDAGDGASRSPEDSTRAAVALEDPREDPREDPGLASRRALGDTQEGNRLDGVVRDRATGEAVAGAEVRCGEITARSDAGGRFTVARTIPGPARLSVAAPGYASHSEELELEQRGDGRVEVLLAPAFAVLVETPDGAPAPGVAVYLIETVGRVGPAGGQDSYHAGPHVTADDGRVFFPEIPRVREGATYWRRVAYAVREGAPAHSDIAEEYVAAPADGSAAEGAPPALRMTLRESLLVRGTIEVPSFFDVTRATVSLQSVYVRDPIAPIGPLFSRYRGSSELWPEAFEAGARRDGRFELVWVPRGAYVQLVASAPGLGLVPLRSSSPDTLENVSISLAAEGVIEGTLHARAGGAPIADRVLVASHHSHQSGGPFQTTTDAEGDFRFAGLPAGVYSVALPYDADRRGGTLPVSASVDVRAGAVARGLRLFLEEGTLVTGRITDARTDSPVAGVGVRALQGPPEHTTPVGDAATDENGEYALLLPSGATRLYLIAIPQGYGRPPDPEEHALSIVYGDAEESGRDFRLTAGEQELPAFLRGRTGELAHATGRVVDAGGLPLADVTVEAHRQWHLEKDEDGKPLAGPWINPTHRTFTAEDGRYRVPLWADKPYKVLATGGRYSAAWSEPFAVEKDAEHEVEALAVRHGTSAISGTVVDPEGRPVANAEIYVSSRSKREGRTDTQPVTNADGSFHVPHLIEGEIVNVVLLRAGFGRHEWLIAPDTHDLRLVAIPESAEAVARSSQRPRRPDETIGKRAPDWKVDWVREPPPPARPDRGDGKRSVVLLTQAPSDWDAFWIEVTELGAYCERHDALLVLVLEHTVHPSVVEPHLAQIGSRVAVGIDRFTPGSDDYPPSATLPAYGWSHAPAVAVIDAGGTVTHALRMYRRPQDLDEALGKE